MAASIWKVTAAQRFGPPRDGWSPLPSRYARGLFAVALSAGAALGAEPAWNSLWNGSDLDGWTTWLATPQPTSEVPGLPRGTDGKYTQVIGVRGGTR